MAVSMAIEAAVVGSGCFLLGAAFGWVVTANHYDRLACTNTTRPAGRDTTTAVGPDATRPLPLSNVTVLGPEGTPGCDGPRHRAP